MSVSNPLVFISRKSVKLWRVWRERNTIGLLKFLYRRSVEKFRGRANYQKWVVSNRLTRTDRLAAERAIEGWAHRPTFSVIMPVYNVEAVWLEKAIRSVQNQIYPHWELCIADDASPKSHIKQILTRYSKLDPRIKVVFRAENGQIVAASNDALALATGDYIALLDHDDELAINALFENAKLINEHPDADFIYSDEDKMDTAGKRLDPFFKPDWSPDYFHACMYTCHLGVYRTSLIREINGFCAGYDGSQDYDLVLRVVERTQQIYHIPKVLYHWRIIPASVTAGGEQAKPWAYIAARQALEAMVARSSYPGWVEQVPTRPGFWRVRRHILGEPLISIIIPSAGKALHTSEGSLVALENCIRSIQERNTYRKFELVLVDGYDIPDSTLATVMQSADGSPVANVRLVRCEEPFNFAHRINQGAANARGEFLLLLNDDTEVTTPAWLESMVEFAQQEAIGAVGAKLLYPDGKIQHGGVMVLGGNPGHAFHGFDGDHPGYFCSNLVNRNYLAVTAACLMIRKDVFDRVGGMDEIFPLNYNDVDFCLKVHQAGYRNVVTPYAQLIHYESLSRKPGLQPNEWETLNQKWSHYFAKLNGDPYYNPNLSQREVTFELW
ncbi:MAG: glycosyltransferase [Stenomitos frigidus ULC029]